MSKDKQMIIICLLALIVTQVSIPKERKATDLARCLKGEITSERKTLAES